MATGNMYFTCGSNVCKAHACTFLHIRIHRFSSSDYLQIHVEQCGVRQYSCDPKIWHYSHVV